MTLTVSWDVISKNVYNYNILYIHQLIFYENPFILNIGYETLTKHNSNNNLFYFFFLIITFFIFQYYNLY